MSTTEIEGTLLDPAAAACPFSYYTELREKAPCEPTDDMLSALSPHPRTVMLRCRCTNFRTS